MHISYIQVGPKSAQDELQPVQLSTVIEVEPGIIDVVAAVPLLSTHFLLQQSPDGSVAFCAGEM